MEIDASAPAFRLIERRGGSLYVWFANLGGSPWTMQRVAFSKPKGVEFSRHPGDGFELYLESRFEAPAKLKIRRRPWPIGPIEVSGTGAGGWGDGGGGGDDGWPGGHGGGDGGGGHGHGGH